MNSRGSQGGFTLLEIMIALTIGLVVIGAVIQMFISGLLVFNTQTGMAKLQENGRFATGFITKDVRLAGFFGCEGQGSVSNNIADSTNNTPLDLDINISLLGEDNVDSAKKLNSIAVKQGSDMLSLKYGAPEKVCEIESHSATNNAISCQANNPFLLNQPLVVTDCNHTAVFLQSNDVTNTTKKLIKHDATTGLNYKNCTAQLGEGGHCSSASYTYNNGMVMALNSATYFVANNSYNQPALFRNVMRVDSSNNLVSSPKELIEGVEDMQILYGEDSDLDGNVNLYAPFTKVNINNVISLRVDLLLRSVESNLTTSFQTYRFNGKSVTASDHHLRKVYSATIAIRNRM